MITFGSLFSGFGGLDLGFERAGLECRWQVEIDDYANLVLEKNWPDVPRFRDVRSFARGAGVEAVDVIAGGFPCQDISLAGRGAGIDGERSGLWSEFERIIRALRPGIVVVENVSALLIRGMGRVLGDLAALGFDAEWDVLPACAFGAPHSRERVFLIADTDSLRLRRWRDRLPNKTRSNHWEATQDKSQWQDMERWIRATVQAGDWWDVEGGIQRMDDRIPERIRAGRGFGNAVVPQIAEWIGTGICNAWSN